MPTFPHFNQEYMLEIEFPSRKHALSWWNSKEYKNRVNARNDSAKVFVLGLQEIERQDILK